MQQNLDITADLLIKQYSHNHQPIDFPFYFLSNQQVFAPTIQIPERLGKHQSSKVKNAYYNGNIKDSVEPLTKKFDSSNKEPTMDLDKLIQETKESSLNTNYSYFNESKKKNLKSLINYTGKISQNLLINNICSSEEASTKLNNSSNPSEYNSYDQKKPLIPIPLLSCNQLKNLLEKIWFVSINVNNCCYHFGPMNSKLIYKFLQDMYIPKFTNGSTIPLNNLLVHDFTTDIFYHPQDVFEMLDKHDSLKEKINLFDAELLKIACDSNHSTRDNLNISDIDIENFDFKAYFPEKELLENESFRISKKNRISTVIPAKNQYSKIKIANPNEIKNLFKINKPISNKQNNKSNRNPNPRSYYYAETNKTSFEIKNEKDSRNYYKKAYY